MLRETLRRVRISLYLVFLLYPCEGWALSSANIPMDSPLYQYLDKLAGLGLIKTDVKGLKPFSKAEAARLLIEAERNIPEGDAESPEFALDLISRVKEVVSRERSLLKYPDTTAPLIDGNLLSSLRLRYVYLDGAPRSYERPVHDPGGDGVFGIGSGLRPRNRYPSPVQQHGSEGTPLLDNNNGVIYRQGNNGDLRWAAEAYVSDKAAFLLEPSVVASGDDVDVRLNRGYGKLGGGGLELEAGRDENWLGQGYRGNITLTNNAENFTLVKLSSPEPVRAKWLPWLGDIKYAFIGSRFEKTYVGGERQPWFYALKLISKPTDNLEVGFNLGRQVGGPGVKDSIGDNIRGLIGGTNSDNSNGLAGFELRYRIPWLRNTEIYGEFSGEDTADFWPIVESYVAGFFIPNLTRSGRNDFRFEFFQGNQILYTNGTFPEGYMYKGLPIGHSQGGATQDFFVRYSHWFTVRNRVALEYFFTQRGNVGSVTVNAAGRFDVGGFQQAVERKNAVRIFWNLPLRDLDLNLNYGIERIHNVNLMPGANRTNQLAKVEISYKY